MNSSQGSIFSHPSDNTVYLNVYDLIENKYTYWCGFGIFHSGIEVYGVEYAFGGHDFDAPGVFATNPREAPGTVIWREAIPMGKTNLSPNEVYELVQEMGRTYRGNKYHLLQMNCNSFSNDLCYKLTGVRPPGWVNRLANLAINLHCLLPQGWVPPLRPPTAWPSEHLPGPAGDDERTGLLEPDGTRRSQSHLTASLSNRAPPQIIPEWQGGS